METSRRQAILRDNPLNRVWRQEALRVSGVPVEEKILQAWKQLSVDDETADEKNIRCGSKRLPRGDLKPDRLASRRKERCCKDWQVYEDGFSIFSCEVGNSVDSARSVRKVHYLRDMAQPNYAVSAAQHSPTPRNPKAPRINLPTKLFASEPAPTRTPALTYEQPSNI